MTIEDYIKEIRENIAQDRSYDEYKSLFFQYIEFLEGILKNNSHNIKAICQLAMAYMEAREPAEKSIALMENALHNFKDSLEQDELAQLLNNLAFFYEEEICNTKKAKELLENAVTINSKFPNTYNALGIIYITESNIIKAINMFSKAIFLSDDIKYKNNYAVALYFSGQIEKSIERFNNISEDWMNNEISANAYYSYGMIKRIIGDITVGIEVANNLSSKFNFDIGIDASKIADLYFICGEYEKCIQMYDYEKYYPSLDWLNIYFYSLYVLDLKDKLERFFKYIITQKEIDIKEEQIDDDENWTYEERKAYIEDLNKDIKDFTDLYKSIVYEGYKPNINFKPELIYGCYLVDCPRHH